MKERKRDKRPAFHREGESERATVNKRDAQKKK